MINRRHIRVKAMQSVYAMVQSKSSDLVKEEKFLKESIGHMYDLYVLSLDLITRVQAYAQQTIEVAKKKHLATSAELNPNLKFVENIYIKALKNSTSLQTYIEDHQLNHWYLDDKYVYNIYQQLIESDFYKKYMKDEDKSPKNHLKFVIQMYSQLIAPSDSLEAYYEGVHISWIDDIPFVNSWVIKTLNEFNPQKDFVLGKLYKNMDDEIFATDLLKKTVLNLHHFQKDIEDKTPNWDTDRIADLDMILIKMAICEFLKFPSIPVKATINEYLEIAKDYSTEKSSFFINGVLDKVWKEYHTEKKLNKVGRGML